MKTEIYAHPRITAAAERQMQSWVHTQESADRAFQQTLQRRLSGCGRTYVTISRETGTNAIEIARLLGLKLGWEVFGKNLVDRVAERLHEPRAMLDMVDETKGNWAIDALGSWLDNRLVSHERYVVYLELVIRNIGRRGKAIFVGRGAQFLLPRDKGLTVRLIASEKHRVKSIMERESLPENKARQLVSKTDQGRREFVSRFFHRDIDDPHLYDLVLNVERLGQQGTVDQIVAALCR